ncbi:MAG TPA: thiamine pyrophosphate-binding protein [Acidimicrobiales bacterium]|jgi:benzoylformate decarboxylase|nr:thiamine pyrophosphate-binding protein [Acidimicrobiales bacterium]
MTARDVLLEVLRTEGVCHLFGNPGSTELPLIDALASADDLRYVLALQEASAVAIAEGFAMATGRPAFLNLHTSAGLGNAIGALTNAQANHTPLVVTAGQQDYRHIATDPLLSGDLTGLARTVSKWVHEVRTSGELGTILRRAFHDAMSPPSGPVFVSIPMDILEDPSEHLVPALSTIDRRPMAGALDELADLLIEPAIGRVAIVVGDDVAMSDAVAEVAELAELLAAPVHGTALHSRGVFPPLHPMWSGMLPPAAVAMNAALTAYERVLLIGARGLMAYPYTPGSAVPSTTQLLHLAADPHELGRVHPTRWAGAGDAKATIAALLPRVRALIDSTDVGAHLEAAAARRRAAIDQLEETALSRYAATPMDPMAAAHALVRAMPPDATVVDEAITTGVYVRGFHHHPVPGRYFFNRGGGLGWGMPAAVGVSLARDREPVLCVVGDGSAMYSPQALWTAAHENTPVVFAVVNNGQYLILKNNLRGMAGESARTNRFVAMDIAEPPIDYLALARSMGVEATSLEKAHDVGEAVAAALASGRPHLLELPIAAPA